MSSKPSLLLYLHGFNSSPLSLKAEILKAYCAEHRPDITFVSPQLPVYPQPCFALLRELCERYSTDYHMGVVGSSLGGYFATWLKHEYPMKAVLVNPAAKPYELLQDYLGPQVNPYTHQQYNLQPQHVEDLRGIDVKNLASPQDFWLLQQTGDEVLDYHQAVAKYQGAKQTIEAGGDHSFVGFERHAKEIIDFLQL
ncbi:esterase YqiA [Vibrio gallicus]|uniref:esterase YqiA n=1 Tax=Vibrio gallicus TaxID=190897 RepID=UPI0021C37419|nr:esterase YqiA [Vibrio gallicus]